MRRPGHALHARAADGLFQRFPNSKMLREKFQHVSSLAEIDEIASQHLAPQGAAI